MKPISTLQTGRYALDFKPISITDEMRVLGIPHHEISTTEFIKSILVTPDIDPKTLTVQERMMIMCHYIGEMGQFYNFKVGEDGALFNYLLFATDYKTATETPLGEYALNGDSWRYQMLTGDHAEWLERLSAEFAEQPKGLYWQAGVMACQLRNQLDPDEIGDMERWLPTRIQHFLNLDSESFFSLSDWLEECNYQRRHFLDVRVHWLEGGLAAYPIEAKESAGLPPATFPCTACCHERTVELHQSLASNGDSSEQGI